jgi:ADP-ribose pyrophosphatase YjhB (NUDIX family)
MKNQITCGIFLKKEDKILICRVTNSKNIWSIPKGLIDKEDESTKHTAIRELREETSIDLEKLNIVKSNYIGSFPYKNRSKILECFLYEINDDLESIKLECLSMVHNNGNPFPEVDKFMWASYEESIELLHNSQIEPLNIIFKK